LEIGYYDTPLGNRLLRKRLLERGYYNRFCNQALGTPLRGGTLVAVFELELIDLGADLGDVVLADLTRYETSSTF